MTRRWSRRVASVALLFVASLALTGGGDVASSARYTRSTRTIRPGLTLVKVHDSRGPNEIRILIVNPAKAVTIDVARASKAFPGMATTGAMAAGHDAVAAINGDFARSPGRPTHAYAEDGQLIQTGRTEGVSFAISQDERSAYIGHPVINIFAHVTSTNEDIQIDEWNEGTPGAGEIVAYAPVGGDAAKPPRDACSARLVPIGRPRWGTGKERIARPYRVDRSACSSTAMDVDGGLVLSARQGSVKGAQLAGLPIGDTVNVTWTYGWPGVADAIAASPQILDNREIIAPTNCGYICYRHPRTGVGITAKGKVLLFVVDGRDPGRSVGMNLAQFARLMRREGAVDGMNFDGGGSTTMIVNGKVVNRPSDGQQRPRANALLVLPGADTGEKIS